MCPNRDYSSQKIKLAEFYENNRCDDYKIITKASNAPILDSYFPILNISVIGFFQFKAF